MCLPILAATSGAVGQKAAQTLYVVRPKSNASAVVTCSPFHAWSSGSPTSIAQPFRPVRCSS